MAIFMLVPFIVVAMGKRSATLHAARTEGAAPGRGLDDEHAAVRHAAIRVVRRDVAAGVRNRSGIDLQILRQAGTRPKRKARAQIRATVCHHGAAL